MFAIESSSGPMSQPPWTSAQLADDDFSFLAERIENHCGIHLAPIKRVMLESRLRKRLRALGLASFADYCRHLDTTGDPDEFERMIDEVTTNKTEFFREPAHFTLLTRHILPRFLAENRRDLHFWSSACSSGEEVFTLAMLLADWCESHPTQSYQVLGSDICTDMLAAAMRAVYDEAAIAAVPAPYRQKYLLRSKDRSLRQVRISTELRRHTSFEQRNLLNGPPRHAVFDVIFCRNVLIYFQNTIKRQVVAGLCESLRVGGYLFLGHSETTNGFNLPLVPVAPAVYQRVE